MDDVREVLKENHGGEPGAQAEETAGEVINEGEVVSMDEAGEEAIERLERTGGLKPSPEGNLSGLFYFLPPVAGDI